MNSNYPWKSIGQVFGVLSISAALAACGSGSTASTAGDSGTPAAVAAVNAPTTTVPTGSVGAASTTTPAASSATPASTTAPASTLPPATADSVTLSWTAPTDNTNGSALTNLAGYQISYGTSPSALTQQISINTVGVMNYVVTNLSSGTWYFEIVAVNSAGVQSTPSGVVSTTI